MPYAVHLDVFDGPFDLLLQLITAQEVDLYEIRLADIIDGFLAELGRVSGLDLETATEFLLIAATLVELKCRRLLPGPDELDDDEELALFEARDYLLARLVECKTFSSAAEALAGLEATAAASLARRTGPDDRFIGLEPDLLAGVFPTDLARAAARALRARVVPTVEDGHVHRDEVSVVETIEVLCLRLADLRRSSFRDLVGPAASKALVVASFLAILELYKRGLLEIDQAESFGELIITWTGSGRTPFEDDPNWAMEVAR